MRRFTGYELTTATMAIGVLISSFFIFRYLVWFVSTDIQPHALVLVRSIENNVFPIPFLYYLTIYAFAGFKADTYILFKSSMIVLSIAVMMKYLMTVRLLSILTSEKSTFLLWVAVCLLVCAPISWSTNQMYLGKAAINVWHNSTTIMTMPFVLLLFGSIVKFLQDDKIEKLSIVSILVFAILNLVTKPSFVFAVIPALPLGVMIYQRQWFSHKIIVATLISLFLSFLIIFEYYIIYEIGDYLGNQQTDSKNGVTISLFRIWFLYGGYYFPMHIISGLLFPIAYCMLFFNDVKQDKLLQFTIVLYAIALAISIIFVETGHRANHGNFVWQVIMTGYVLFTVVSARMLTIIRRIGWSDKKSKVLLVTFTIHCIYGIAYITKIIVVGNYS
jgi:hypothetical protein